MHRSDVCMYRIKLLPGREAEVCCMSWAVMEAVLEAAQASHLDSLPCPAEIGISKSSNI